MKRTRSLAKGADDKPLQESASSVHRSQGPRKGVQSLTDRRNLTKWVIVICIVLVTGYLLWHNVMSIGKSSKKPPQKVKKELKPKIPSGMKQDVKSDNRKQDMTSHPNGKTGDDCDALIARAGELLQHGPAGYEPALDMLARCALQNESHAAARWNMAVILIKAGKNDEALYHMQAAVEIEPDNEEYHRGTGSLMINSELYEEGVVMLERYVELKLGLDSFPDLLEKIAGSAGEDLQFLVAEGNEVLGALDKLLMAYLKQRWLRKSDNLYQVLVNLSPDNDAMHSSYAFFAIGIGKIATGIYHLRREMELKFLDQQMGSEDDAFGVIEAHALRLLTTGFDAHVVNIGRNILISSSEEMITLIGENCGSDVIDVIGSLKLNVSLSQLREVFAACLLRQNVLGPLLHVDGSLFSENHFGWNAFLHVVLLGDSRILQQFLSSKADIQGRTYIGLTAWHVVAMRGYHSLSQPIIAAGLNPDELDYYNRSALDVACLHRWSMAEFSNLMRRDDMNCSLIPMYDSKPGRYPDGSFLHAVLELPTSLTSERCDFDVRLGLTPEEFLRDYLSIQRPVLIRNATGNWAGLKTKWQRHNLDAKYGKLTFRRVIVPYAQAFGLDASIVTLHDFLSELSALHASQSANQQPEDISSLPPYIFDSLSSESPLMSDFTIPPVLDPNVTQITTQTVQFYIGPPLSGAPVHFHRSAWNALVYGKKRWFLYPPTKSFYSKQHIWLWYNEVYAQRRDALECVQSAGDVLFVPDLWAHGVVNLMESVGFASEFIFGSSEFSI